MMTDTKKEAKFCPKCRVTKSRTAFYSNRARHDGLKVYCKICDKSVSKVDYLKAKTRNPFRLIWNAINNRCNNQSHNKYSYYGGKGIKNFLSQEDIKYLWLRDKASLLKNPSIDRINEDWHYCLGNCRFIELEENIQRSKYAA